MGGLSMTDGSNFHAAVYRDALSLFLARLRMKHLLKGTEHRTFPLSKLRLILEDEIKELDDEIHELKAEKIIDEAADVMISAMRIIDRILHPKGVKNNGR
jgi:hypothetical protein